MRSELFQPTPASEGRLLLLIDSFTTGQACLDGRTKLAKLDFLLRYPTYLRRALEIRGVDSESTLPPASEDTIESRMVRYRFGPWDPAYFSLLGRLISRQLVEPVPLSTGIGFRSTASGRLAANRLRENEAWSSIANSAKLLKRHFNLSGTFLKDFIYANFPEVTGAKWGDEL